MSKKKIRVCGLDEAGRGALAGPLLVAAVVMPSDFRFEKVAPDIIVRDSKELSDKQRRVVFEIIKKHSFKIDTEAISVKDINKKGINWANTEGFRRLIMRNDAEQYIVDGRWHLPNLGNKNALTSCVIRADQKIPAVLAAGIVTKIKRDKIMKELHSDYPLYGWDTNTGHATRQHISEIKKHGICKHHRLQFVNSALQNSQK